jgi:hypothetical protein
VGGEAVRPPTGRGGNIGRHGRRLHEESHNHCRAHVAAKLRYTLERCAPQMEEMQRHHAMVAAQTRPGETAREVTARLRRRARLDEEAEIRAAGTREDPFEDFRPATPGPSTESAAQRPITPPQTRVREVPTDITPSRLPPEEAANTCGPNEARAAARKRKRRAQAARPDVDKVARNRRRRASAQRAHQRRVAGAEAERRTKEAKFLLWNVNGIRSRLKQGHFLRILEEEDPDVLILTEFRFTYKGFLQKHGVRETLR